MGIGVGLFAFAILSGLIYIGLITPEPEVVPGRQVRARFMSQIRNLNILEEGEQVEFFYSDALFNIEEGFCLLTDRKVVIYCRDYHKPSQKIPFSDIADLSVTYDNSFWNDSRISITLTDDTVATFPVSSEHGGDKRFYKSLMKKWKEAQNADGE